MKRTLAIAVAAVLVLPAGAAPIHRQPAIWPAARLSQLSVAEPAAAADGFMHGRCNASLLQATLAGATEDDSGELPMLHGSVAAATPDFDAVDRACLGGALEQAPGYFEVRWTNPLTGGNYAVTPMRRFTRNGSQCRLFSARQALDGDTPPLRATACRHGRDWYLI